MVPKAAGQDAEDKQVIQQKFQGVKHTFTFDTVAAKVVQAAKAYQAEDKNVPSYKQEQFRPEFIKKVGLQ